MEEIKWELLTEVLGQVEGEMLKLYFQTCGIEVELFEEATSSGVGALAGCRFTWKRRTRKKRANYS